MTSDGKPAFAALGFALPSIKVERRDDGSLLLRSNDPLQPYPPTLIHYLDHWALAEPDRTFLAERSPGGDWQRLAFASAAQTANAIAQGLIDRGLDGSRPVMILSGNSIDHALMMLGCFRAGVPVAPVSPAYSLMSGDFAKVKYIFDLVRPGLIYASAAEPFRAALDAIGAGQAELVVTAPPPADLRATRFTDLAATMPTPAVAGRAAAVTPDSVAKILFTSGSTGLPKGVINTHGMLSANQQSAFQVWPFLADMPPVLVDWLPWNHTFGGNHNFNMVLRHGGTLYIDAGKPAPGLIEQTVKNLREISPNIYFNVPAGFSMLLPFLERDKALAQTFLKSLKLIFYAAAALPQDLWERLEALTVRHLGHRVMMTSAWGSTETAPLATSAHFPLERAGNIGVPVPGVELKMVPSGAKLELRVRGPNVTPGYYRRPDLTADAFDAEGFYRIGDAGRLADPDRPELGLVFDGRIAEDFKLDTGTWVHVGGLRVAALAACSPLLQDAVVCGHDRHEVGILAWPNLAACRELAPGATGTADVASLLRAPEIVSVLRTGLERHNTRNPASSVRIGRLHLMQEPPSIDANEITDKGYINQRAAIERRAALVERLYAATPGSDPDVIVLP